MATINHELIKNNEIANTINWSIGLPLPSFISSAISIAELITGVTSPGNYLNLYCKDCEIPTRKITYEEVWINRKRYTQPVEIKSQGVTKLVFYETSLYNISRLFEFWCAMIMDPFNQLTTDLPYQLPRGFSITALNNYSIFNPRNNFSLSSAIVAETGEIQVTDKAMDKNPVASWELFYSSPEDVSFKSLGGTPELQEVSVNLRYNNFKRNF